MIKLKALKILSVVPEFPQSKGFLIALYLSLSRLIMYVLSLLLRILTPSNSKIFSVKATSPLVRGFLIIEIPSARLAAIKALCE